MNLNNFGVLRGRIITTDIPKHRFLNHDGSVTMLLSIATKRNFTTKDGKDSDIIPIQVFIPAKLVTIKADGSINAGIWDDIKTGDQLILQVHVKANPYFDQTTNKMVYPPPVIQVDSFVWDETLAEKQARRLRKTNDTPIASDHPVTEKEITEPVEDTKE